MEQKNAFIAAVGEAKFAACAREDQVLVEIHTREETKTAGGIIIPGESEARPDAMSKMATVLSVGEGIAIPGEGERMPIDLKVNDMVYVKNNRGAVIPLPGTQASGRTIVAISCHDILCVLREPDDVNEVWSPDIKKAKKKVAKKKARKK